MEPTAKRLAEYEEAIENMSNNLGIVRDCLAQPSAAADFAGQRQMIQDLLHGCEVGRDQLGTIAMEVAEHENGMDIFHRVREQLDRLERLQTEFSAWSSAGPGGAANSHAAVPSSSGGLEASKSDSRGQDDPIGSRSGGGSLSSSLAPAPPPSSSLSEVSAASSGRRDKSKKDKKEKKDKKKPGGDDGFGSGFGAAADLTKAGADGRGTPASASGFGTWLSPNDEGPTSSTGVASALGGASWGSGAQETGKWPSAGSSAAAGGGVGVGGGGAGSSSAWGDPHGASSDAFPKEATGSSMAAGSSTSAPWGTSAGLDAPAPSFGGGFSDTTGSGAGASGTSWAATGSSPKDGQGGPPGPPSATMLGQAPVPTILMPSGTMMQGSAPASASFGAFPDESSVGSNSRAPPFESAWSLGAPVTPQSASSLSMGHPRGSQLSSSALGHGHSSSSHPPGGCLGDPGVHRATMTLQVPYIAVSGELDEFYQRFARAAAQATGVAQNRVRVRAVYPG